MAVFSTSTPLGPVGKWARRGLIAAALLAGAAPLASLGLTGVAWAADQRAPLLMDGKTTLYQRVLCRPGAYLYSLPGAGKGSLQPALTRFYVYGRQSVDGKEWVEVGLTDKGKTQGWMPLDQVLPWTQQLTLAFTNPAGRDRALFFSGHDDLLSVIENENPGALIQPLRTKIEAGGQDPRIVSIEPATHIDIAEHFYLLPILKAEETFSAQGHRVRLLDVASVSLPGTEKPAAAKADDNSSGALRSFSAAVVFVIDSTVSMGPYIDRTREAVRTITERMDAAGLSSKVKFGLVAYRSSIEASPGLEYVTRIYADPSKVKDGKDFLHQIQDLKAATVSSARFSEDAFGGIVQAIDHIDWDQFGGRYVVLITDAGALKGNDPLSSTGLNAEQVRLEAEHRGLAVYTMHLKTPAGSRNHAEAEAQYSALSYNAILGRPLYYPVNAGSVEAFGKMVDSLASSMVAQVQAASAGKEAAGHQPHQAEQKPAATAADDQVRLDTQALGHAMQLAYLGRVQGTQAPLLFNGWISDRDLVNPDTATTEVRVLLSRNQLSDMEQVLARILEAGEAAQLAPDTFFSMIQSATAVMGRDPNAVTKGNAIKLADLGLMGEYLDDLPYRSKILDIDQQTWSSWSISQQQAFLDEIHRKQRLYRKYNQDVSRWVALDGGADPGAAVYPVPLDALP
jgi:hypothetical protein